MAHNAIVLAAGGSTRLGRAKQLLTRDGETLVHRAVRLALSTEPVRMLLVVGANAHAVAKAVADLPVEIVSNPDWRKGLASSLRTAVPALVDDAASVLILGCDQPALEPDHLRRLLAGAMTSLSGCAATAHAAAPGIPVVVDATLLRHARGLQGDTGLRGLLLQLPADSMYSLQAPELQFDVDTPEELEAAVRKGWLDRP